MYRLENLTGIHDAFRIERFFDPVHLFLLDIRLVSGEFPALELANAMFCAETALQSRGDIVDAGFDVMGPGQEGFAVTADGLHKIEMNIAVTDMAERGDTDAGDRVTGANAGAVQEFRDPGHRYRHIVPEDAAGIAALRAYQDWDSGYSKQQSTRPQTIGYGLVDSPIGLAGWIIEKFWRWTDCDGDPENALSLDEMLDDVMLYWLPATGAASARIYWESFGKPILKETGPVSLPAGCSLFPKEIFQPPRHWAERTYANIVHWNTLDKGGHFAAFEQPASFVDEVRTCFRPLR